MGNWVFGYAGLAVLYALLTSGVILLAARLAGRFSGWRIVPVLFATLTFVFLTQHPFPVAADLQCPVPGVTPQLEPFRFWEAFAHLSRQDADLMTWLGNRTVSATTMNFFICAVIGLSLAFYAGRPGHGLAFAAFLPLCIETTQLTGIWGVYPCAYRQFDIDDLILNVLGVMTGFLVARRFFGITPSILDIAHGNSPRK